MFNLKSSKLSLFGDTKNLEKDYSPIDDMRASKQYRLEIAKNLLLKCFFEIKNQKMLRINQ